MYVEGHNNKASRTELKPSPRLVAERERKIEMEPTSLIKSLRKAKGWTARDIAVEIGVPEMRVYAVERGRYRCRPDEARRWAAVLGIPPEVAFPDVNFTDTNASAKVSP